MGSKLADKAMIVRVSISQWTARRYDRKVSDKVASDYGASSEAGRYNKLLVAQEAIKAIAKIAGDARTFHYGNTLPWEDGDIRLLPSANYMPYTAKMREFREKFDTAVADFMAVYPSLVEDARRRLNGMFDASDYPLVSELPRRYGFNVAVSPLADASDFRVDLQASEIQAIRADIEFRLREAQERANAELWQRLFDSVSHMADKLAEVTDDGKQGIFRNSLVGNVAELCDLLPRLNVTEDANLEAMRAEVLAKLATADVDTLRKDTATRKQAATDAAAILAAMSGYMGK